MKKYIIRIMIVLGGIILGHIMVMMYHHQNEEVFSNPTPQDMAEYNAASGENIIVRKEGTNWILLPQNVIVSGEVVSNIAKKTQVLIKVQ